MDAVIFGLTTYRLGSSSTDFSSTPEFPPANHIPWSICCLYISIFYPGVWCYPDLDPRPLSPSYSLIHYHHASLYLSPSPTASTLLLIYNPPFSRFPSWPLNLARIQITPKTTNRSHYLCYNYGIASYRVTNSNTLQLVILRWTLCPQRYPSERTDN